MTVGGGGGVVGGKGEGAGERAEVRKGKEGGGGG